MSSCHTIRLHAAWKRMVTQGQDGQAVSVSLPDQTLLHCGADCVTYQRHFNQPTGIDQQTAVLLDCGLLRLAHLATLNGQTLQLPLTGLPDITSLLRPHNELEIVLCADRFAEAAAASAMLQIVR